MKFTVKNKCRRRRFYFWGIEELPLADLILLGITGVFQDFDDSLWSKSTIYNLCGPLGPNVDATVKIANAKQKLNSRNSVLF